VQPVVLTVLLTYFRYNFTGFYPLFAYVEKKNQASLEDDKDAWGLSFLFSL
jgi:hypothetical protein